VSNSHPAGRAINSPGSAVFKWQIRVKSVEPVKIDDAEIIYRRSFTAVLDRASVTIARTSYMVGQPNREVYWAIDIWNDQRQRWDQIIDGRSRLKKGAGPQ
jgi:hypothetical protein